MTHITLSALSQKLEPIMADLDEHSVDEDTMVGFNDGFEPVVGDVGTEPLIAWLRWNPRHQERSIDLQTTKPKSCIE